jgi:poly(3-hydroxybutyrate) depolymerase
MKSRFLFCRRGVLLLLLLNLVLFLLGCSAGKDPIPALPKMQTDPERLYLAGLSSGATMAHQLHLAWPEEIRGVALFSASPYACARQGVSAALHRCMGVSRGVPSVETTLLAIQESAAEGQIGDPEHLASSRVYLYRGGVDPVVNWRVSEVVEKSYAQLVDEGLLSYTQPFAGHGLPTERDGVACALTAAPFMNACGFSGAAAGLEHLDGAVRHEVTTQTRGQLLPFDQRVLRGASKGLADQGFVYLPDGCAEPGRCGLLMVLHGCEQASEVLGETFIRQSGYLQQADARELVVVFPQVSKSLPNPKGCWDWWGYESSAFDTREGPQMQALHRIWRHFTGSP